MKLKTVVLSLSMVIIFTTSAFAEMGQIGLFGGISEGTRLPKTTELILAQQNTRKRASTTTLPYKEMLFLTGVPVEFEGNITLKTTAIPTTDVGTYRETVEVKTPNNAASEAIVDRKLVLTTNYRKVEGTNQIIKDSEVVDKNKNWDEEITINGITYVLVPELSHISRSILEDNTPGITYYKGNISETAVYTYSMGEDDGDGENVENRVTMRTSGTIYGYESSWSKTETHILDVFIEANEAGNTWQLEAQVRPTFVSKKTLQYSVNEPTAISFDGNYYEVMSNESGLNYDIYTMPRANEKTVDRTGSLSIPSVTTFEQLSAPDMGFLKGHFAESDIKKLFSMQILDGDPKQYQPNQAITRGQLVTMLVKAIKLPIESPQPARRSSRKITINFLFPDVTDQRGDYPYIMAAYNSNLAVGKSDGLFKPDEAIDRQEAITILLRTLGLTNLGLEPTPVTVFTDDSHISPWAKKEIYAATRIGIVAGDLDGRFRPRDKVSKAEGAALVNRLVNYMRSDIILDYKDHLVNY